MADRFISRGANTAAVFPLSNDLSTSRVNVFVKTSAAAPLCAKRVATHNEATWTRAGAHLRKGWRWFFRTAVGEKSESLENRRKGRRNERMGRKKRKNTRTTRKEEEKQRQDQKELREGGREGERRVAEGFSIDNQWSASAGLKVQWREIDLDSRYWLSQSDLVQGTPGTAAVFAMQSRRPCVVATDERETRAHAIRPLPSKACSSLSRHDTHGYVRLFRYADDPAERPTGTRNNRDPYEGEGRATGGKWKISLSAYVNCVHGRVNSSVCFLDTR